MSLMAARLKELMENRGLSQSDLAEDLEVTQGAISKILVGKTQHSRLMPMIAAKYGVALDWLLGEVDEPDGSRSIFTFTRDEELLVEHVRALDPTERKAVLTLIDSLWRRAPVISPTHQLGTDVSCSGSRYGGCRHYEDVAFAMPKADLEWLAGRYAPGIDNPMQIRFRGRGGQDFDVRLMPAEAAAILKVVKDYKSLHGLADKKP